MKLLRNPVVVGILALAAVVMVLYQVFGDKVFRVRRLFTSKPATATTASALAVLVEQRFKSWVSAPLRDPFLLLVPGVREPSLLNEETNSPVPTWKLKAIWNQTGSRLAVINRGVYREGDEIQGYRILKIEGDEVWFQGPTRRERLGFDRRSSKAAPPPRPAAPQPPPRP
jgi:hypothetical protein